jgi:hypothetical protein
MAVRLVNVFGLLARPASSSEQDRSDGRQDGDGQEELCAASSVRHSSYPDPPAQCRSKATEND